MASFHYPVGGSKIELAELCSGSPKAMLPYANVPAGAAAQRGTRIHGYVEISWKQEFQNHAPSKEEKQFLKTLNAKEKQTALAFIEALKLLCQKYSLSPAEIKLEEQVSFYQDIAGGTPDVYGVKLFGDFLMIDFKTGRHQVDPTENLQLLFYVCSILRNMDKLIADTLENVHLVILQSESDAPVIHTKTWSIERHELGAWDLRFQGVVDRVINNPDLRTAGDHCTELYCSAAGTCEAHIAYMSERSLGMLDRVMAGEPENPRGVRLGQLLRVLPNIKKWVELVEEDTKTLLTSDPNAVPGFHLGEQAHRYDWIDEKKVKAKCKELGIATGEITDSKLISQSSMKALCQMKGVDASWVDGYTAPLTHKRIKKGDPQQQPAVDMTAMADKFLSAV